MVPNVDSGGGVTTSGTQGTENRVAGLTEQQLLKRREVENAKKYKNLDFLPDSDAVNTLV